MDGINYFCVTKKIKPQRNFIIIIIFQSLQHTESHRSPGLQKKIFIGIRWIMNLFLCHKKNLLVHWLMKLLFHHKTNSLMHWFHHKKIINSLDHGIIFASQKKIIK